MKKTLIASLMLILLIAGIWAQENIPLDTMPAPAVAGEFTYNDIKCVNVTDCDNDDGTSVIIKWEKKQADSEFDGTYSLYRIDVETGEERLVKGLIIDNVEYTDSDLERNHRYKYYIAAVNKDGMISSSRVYSEEIKPVPNWFKKDKIILFLMIIAYTTLILIFVQMVRNGREFFLRKISGLDALDEAVGRATEMGKPILYVPGLSSMADIATIASLNILGPVAKKVAEYESRIIVPNRDPIVMTVAKEVVKEAFTEAGRPDSYDDNDVFFLTDSQFGFAAAVNGIMVRERPATNLFLGMFWAESLILAETGNTTGAIQIAGTDAVTQLPFFITSCDYTIIGEELYAASAYLSGEPVLMGSIKAQDYLKAFLILCILVFFLFFLIKGITGMFSDTELTMFNGIMNIIRFIFNT